MLLQVGLEGPAKAQRHLVMLNNPAGQLITTVRWWRSAAFGISTNTPALTASISGTASAVGISTNTPTLGAEANLTATAAFGMSGTLTAYAIGMEGSTADQGVTVDNIVIALEAAVLPVNIVKVNDAQLSRGAEQPAIRGGP